MLYLVFAGEHVGLKFVRDDGDAILACPSCRCLPTCRVPDETVWGAVPTETVCLGLL
jgi:hypothetical protein